MKEPGAWLDALPVSSLGLCMDNNTVRVAVGLRLGSPLCCPHTCHHCGVQVEGTATHGLSCKWSKGHHQLLSTTSSTMRYLQPICLPGWNQLVSPALIANAPIESHWYPGGVVGSSCGTPPVWTHLPPPTYQVPLERQEQWQPWLSGASKYSALNQHYNFTPVAIETAGPFGP